MTVFRCGSCSAPLDPAGVEGSLVRCAYCDVAQPSPFPARRVIAALDPAALGTGGWHAFETRVRSVPGHPPEALVQAELDPGRYLHALQTTAVFDDFEATIALRMLWGDLTTSLVSLMFRKSEASHYAVNVSTAGELTLVRFAEGITYPIVPWLASQAIAREPGAVNELHVRVEGDRIAVTINGRSVLVARHELLRQGSFAISSYSKVPMAYAIRRAEIIGIDPVPMIEILPTASQGVVITLLATGEKKINVLRAIRELTGLGLGDAKKLVDTAPVRIGVASSDDEARRWIAHLTAQGARAKAERVAS